MKFDIAKRKEKNRLNNLRTALRNIHLFTVCMLRGKHVFWENNSSKFRCKSYEFQVFQIISGGQIA
jgi:hypothetical protein